MSNVIPLPEDWDTEDYSLVESELLPVNIFTTNDAWYWRVNHPRTNVVGPFASAKEAYQNMMQYDKEDDEAFTQLDQINLMNMVKF